MSINKPHEECPLPWKASSDSNWYTSYIRDHDYQNPIAKCYGGEQTSKYIVHACNAYPKLVEFAKLHVLSHGRNSLVYDLLEELGEL